jgi:hypothetical protein
LLPEGDATSIKEIPVKRDTKAGMRLTGLTFGPVQQLWLDIAQFPVQLGK